MSPAQRLSVSGFAILLLIALMMGANHVAARLAFNHGVDVLTAVIFRSGITSLVVLLSKTPTRAPSRVALVKNCCTITTRPNSIIPKMNRKKTGATIANSTALAPLRFFRLDRQTFSNLIG